MHRAHARRAAQRDNNEREYVKAWTQLGCLWIAQPPGSGFDGILISPHTGIHIVEVKNPEGFGVKLTPGELQTKLEVEALGVSYNIVSTLEEALALIGAE